MAWENYRKTTKNIKRLILSRLELIITENRKLNVVILNEQKETVIQLPKKEAVTVKLFTV